MLLLLIKFSSHLRPRKFHRKEKKRKEKKRKVCLSVSIMEVEKIIMEEERRVMVAVDESEESMYALSWCLTNLLSQNSKTNTLVLLYVKPPAPVSSSLDAPGFLFAGDVVASMEQYGKDLANSVMSRAEVVYRDCNNPVKVEKKIGTGDAKDVICIAAEKLDADILVMGSHDYGFFKRVLLGSVSDHCAKHVKCPVVVVKRPKNVY